MTSIKGLISVDPGIRACGVAFFIDGWLICAEHVKNSALKGNGPLECAKMAEVIVDSCVRVWNQIEQEKSLIVTEEHLVIEWPTTYGGRSAVGDVRDLFPLAGIGSALAARFRLFKISHYVPREWKGNIDPDVMIHRIQSRLTEEEHKRVRLPSAKSLHHNVWDAVGIGLKALGRLERQRFARD